MNRKQYNWLVTAMLAMVFVAMFPVSRPSPDYDSIKWRLAEITTQSRPPAVTQAYMWATAIGILASLVGIAFLFGRKKIGIWLYSIGTAIQIGCYLILPVYLFTGAATTKLLIFFVWSGFAIAFLTAGPARSCFVEEKKQNSEPAGGAYVSPAAGDPSAHP